MLIVPDEVKEDQEDFFRGDGDGARLVDLADDRGARVLQAGDVHEQAAELVAEEACVAEGRKDAQARSSRPGAGEGCA
jgi:hypothetical protein